MNVADQESLAKVDENREFRRKRRAVASIAEIYFYLALAGLVVAAKYFKERPDSAGDILSIFTSPSVAALLIWVFIAFFVTILTGQSPLVTFFADAKTFKEVLQTTKTAGDILSGTLDAITTTMLSVGSGASSGRPPGSAFEATLEVYRSRSAEAARAAQRKPNALLFVGTTIALAGLVFFVLTLPGGQFGLQPISQLTRDDIWVASINLLPRLLMLVFIQVLAGFFLKQYRAAMEEYRYYESVLRHRENQHLSYLLLEQSQKPELSHLAKDFLKVQSFVNISRAETTTIIEAQKAEANEFTTVTDKLIQPIGKAANVAKRATKAIKKEGIVGT